MVEPGVLGAADPVLHPGVRRVAGLELGQVPAAAAVPAGRGVGGEGLEPPPVVVGEPQLRPGVGAFPAHEEVRWRRMEQALESEVTLPNGTTALVRVPHPSGRYRGRGEAEVLAGSSFGVDGGGGPVFGAPAGVQAPDPALPVHELMVVAAQESAVVDMSRSRVSP